MSGLEAGTWDVLFHQSPAATLVHDGTKVRACNEAAAQLLGIPLEDMEGKPLEPLISEASRDDVRARFQRGDESTFIGMIRRADGQEVPARVTPRHLTLDGEVLRLAVFDPIQDDDDGALRDAVAREAELRRLKENSRFKTQILNTTAHELNTPLTPVRLQLHLLTTGALGALGDRHSKAIGIIDRNIERLSYLVNDILDVARLESGRLDVNLRPVPLAGALDETMESFEETARRVGVRLRQSTDIGIMVHADRDRLTQVLFNLVGNALKFTPEGGRVDLRAHTESGQAVIEVADTGPGLTADQIGRLFQPFSRVHDTQSSTIAGTGLGLYICKGLMDAHEGTIEATSAGPGKGSTFTIRIPLSDVPQPTPRAKPLARPRPDPLAERLRELI